MHIWVSENIKNQIVYWGLVQTRSVNSVKKALLNHYWFKVNGSYWCTKQRNYINNGWTYIQYCNGPRVYVSIPTIKTKKPIPWCNHAYSWIDFQSFTFKKLEVTSYLGLTTGWFKFKIIDVTYVLYLKSFCYGS